MKIIHNATRYLTEDLQALLDFLVAHTNPVAPLSDIKFSFIEDPSRTLKQTVHRFSEYGDQAGQVLHHARRVANYASSKEMRFGTIMIAPPELWLPPLAELAFTSGPALVPLPSEGVHLLADVIKNHWRGADIKAPLRLNVRVDLVAVKPNKGIEKYLKKKSIFYNNTMRSWERLSRIRGELAGLAGAIRHLHEQANELEANTTYTTEAEAKDLRDALNTLEDLRQKIKQEL